MFIDLRLRRLEMAKKKRIQFTLMRPHTFVCCACFSDTYAPSPAGRLSDVVDLTARRLGIHIKTPPGDTAKHTRTAERQVKGLFLVFCFFCKDGRVHPHITAAKTPPPVFPSASSDVALPDSGQVTPRPPPLPSPSPGYTHGLGLGGARPGVYFPENPAFYFFVLSINISDWPFFKISESLK